MFVGTGKSTDETSRLETQAGFICYSLIEKTFLRESSVFTIKVFN